MLSIAEFVNAKLAYEVDVLDASAGLASGEFILVDTRKQASWDHGHARGATHMPSVDGDLWKLCQPDAPWSSTVGVRAVTAPLARPPRSSPAGIRCVK